VSARGGSDSRASDAAGPETRAAAAGAAGGDRPSADPAAASGAAARSAADTEARRMAVRRFDGCVALEAGAGTGKTAVLVSRIVAWCLGPGWARAAAARPGEPEERLARRVLSGVVAITFTEAAAAEMALRVGQALRALERGARPVGLEAGDVPPAELAAPRARSLLAALDALVAQSIHAFCRRLLAAHPLEAGLHPRFEVDGDGAGRRAAVREVLRREVAAAFAAGPENDLARFCLHDAGAAALEDVLAALLEQGVEPALFADDPFAPARCGRLLGALHGALAALVDADAGRAASLPARQKAPEVLQAARHALAAAAAAPPSAAGLAALAAQLREAFPPGRLQRVAAWGRGRFTGGEEEAFADAVPSLRAAAAALHPLLAHAAALEPARLQRACRVVGPLLAAARARLAEEGLVPFAQLLTAARDLLARHPEIAAEERRRIDQLLVDEFQDTDPIQCDIVARLALEGPAPERPGLFLVGDPKQSIYGWRSADLAAYEAFLRRALGGARPLVLSVNRRSPAAILDEVERVVAPVMREEAGVQPRFEALLEDPGRDVPPAASPVEVWAWIDADDVAAHGRSTLAAGEARRLEAEEVARDLRRLHQQEGVAYGACAVLVRAAREIEAVLDALREADVPFAVESDRADFARREIVDAAALVRAVLDPNDALALVAWLRSPAVGVPDAAWRPLWERGLPRLARALYGWDETARAGVEAAVRAAGADVRAAASGVAPPAGFEDALVAALADLALLRESFDRDAPDRFVERLRRVTLLEASEAARPLGAHRLARLDRFLRELLGWLESGAADATAVTRALREASERAPDPWEGTPRSPLGDAVRVMTIHKAKGLDFDHVYLLAVDKAPGPQGGGHTEVCRADEPAEYRLFGACTPGFHALAARRAQRGRAEEVRTLYVALTRARCRVVVSGRLARAPVPLDEARSHADLLAHRRGGRPDPAVEPARASQAGVADLAWDGVRWRFPLLEPRAGGAPPGAGARGRRAACASPAEIEAAAARLAALGREAAARAARPRTRGAAPDGEGEGEGEAAAAAPDARAPGPAAGARAAPRREVARAVGSAVHAVLETLDLGVPRDEARARADAGVERRLEAARLGPAAAHARAQVRRVLDGFFDGPLHAALVGLGPHVVARELPILLAPGPADGPDAPVGCWSGVADLVYRDPTTGEVVVADYKTDRAAGEGGPPAPRYRAQGLVYARAVQAALGLAALPRFELWWLASGKVERVPLEDGPAEV